MGKSIAVPRDVTEPLLDYIDDICNDCGEKFKRYKRNSSHRCKKYQRIHFLALRKRNNDKNKRLLPDFLDETCIGCGSKFTKSKHATTTFRCEKCREKYHKEYHKNYKNANEP